MKNKKLSLLIVDDNENFVRRMISLVDEVHNVGSIQTASNCQDAIRALDNKQHDVVLLDISMPGGNGISLLRNIRKLKWGCEVIMISNRSGIFYREECRKLGVTHFLDKTREFDQVAVILDSFDMN